MNTEIAVLVDEKGMTTSVFKQGLIKVYTRVDDGWQVAREIPIDVDTTGSLKEIRDRLSAIVSLLNETKIIVASEFSGIQYNIFDAAGFDIFEVSGSPSEFLDYVNKLQGEHNRSISDKTKNDKVLAFPVRTEIEGNYYINLDELQVNNPEITSKQAIIPFLKSEKFHALEVVCSHIPPWFDIELDKLGLKYDSDKTGKNQYTVTIYHKLCNE